MAIDQRKLNPELAEWLDARQRSLKIVKTTTTPSGQTLDWVPIESQHPDGKIASPPPLVHLPVGVGDKTRPAKAAGLELDDPRIERGPAGSVPIVRPDISKLTRTISLRDFLRKRGGFPVQKHPASPQPTDPGPGGSFFHATAVQSVRAFGCDFIPNVWDPSINNPPSSGQDHSILQTWLANFDNGLQTIEGGWTVDQSLNGDTQPHVFTYYTTNGYAQDGDNLGGYNARQKGWTQVSGSSFPGSRLTPVSTFGSSPQFEISMKFQLYREPTNGELNWWVMVQGVWMGYYAASLFNGGIGNVVESIKFGGEVATELANPGQTQDQMGSGWQAEAGWTRAAYMRNLRNQSDLEGTMVDHDGAQETDAPAGVGTNPYDVALSMQSGTDWGSFLFVGGPRVFAPPSATFNQITFNIETGGDDLRGDSSATAAVFLPTGTQTFTLKAQHDPGWGNNSSHSKSFTIAGPAQPRSAFGAITFALTSHNSLFESDDNWNIQSVSIILSGPGGSACLLNQGGNPLARLTGSVPVITLQPGTGC
jgi:hypothetical protein